MEREEFEKVTQDVFDALPERFHNAIENVHIVVEDYPDNNVTQQTGFHPGGLLLGLYEGIPLNRRGVHYGTWPIVPDKITLFRRNIERIARSDAEVREAIRETLIHEIGHYFGMSEQEIRNAGY